METTLEVKQVTDLTYAEYKQLCNLNLRKNGWLYYDIQHARHSRSLRYKAIILKDETGRVLSWALINKYEKLKSRKYVTVADFSVYTRVSERGQGYAKLVYRRAVQIAGGRAKMIIHPHDETSACFFKSVHNPALKIKDYR